MLTRMDDASVMESSEGVKKLPTDQPPDSFTARCVNTSATVINHSRSRKLFLPTYFLQHISLQRKPEQHVQTFISYHLLAYYQLCDLERTEIP